MCDCSTTTASRRNRPTDMPVVLYKDDFDDKTTDSQYDEGPDDDNMRYVYFRKFSKTPV